MFEDYLQDASDFIQKADNVKSERQKKQYFRVAVFCSAASLEAFINFIGTSMQAGDIFNEHEKAFLLDRKFELKTGRFEMVDKSEFHRLEDKLKFLINKFIPGFKMDKDTNWSRLLELKKLRDAITHPKSEDDEISVSDYNKVVKKGLSATIEIINQLLLGIFNKPLRNRILDLK